MKTPDSRGQFFSVDLMVSALIFLFIIILTMTVSGEFSGKILLKQQDNERDEAAIRAGNALVYSPGEPANWQNQAGITGVSAIGLADSKNRLDNAKVQRLADLNQGYYNEVRDLLGANKFGVQITILTLEGVKRKEFGLKPAANKRVSAVNRIAILNNENVLVRVRVFEQ